MIPILYESNETLFASNGLGRLRDVIECKVVEERNGLYECDFSYPVTGAHYDEIIEGRIVGVTHDDTDDIQPFDIVSRTEKLDGIVEFHCTHISYRQTKMVTWGTGINSLADAFQCFRTTCRPEGNPFHYNTDKDSTGYVAAFDGTPRSIRSILGGVEGSILDTYGGEYEWDKWTVRLHSARGEQRDFTIRYGVNLTDYENDSDASEVYNTCVPFWKDSDGNVVLGGEVSSGRSTIGSGDKCVPLDLSDKFDEAPSVADLQSMAQNYMTSNQTFAPSQNIKVSFARIQDEAGFDQFDTLLRCQLCDSIRVIYPLYNMSAYYKIVKTTWNVLLDRYDEMELGNLSTTLAEALGVGNNNGSASSGGGGLVDMFYPVGSYYETSDTTFNPNTAWGGTWVLEVGGQVHVSSGANYSVSGALSNASDGGSKDAVVIYHTHKVSSGWQAASGQPDRIMYGAVNGDYYNSGYGDVQFLEGVGVNGTDKNMQPYIVVNRWHRTA